MGYSKKSVRQTIPYVSVFQHHADDEIDDVRRTILQMVCQCVGSRQAIPDFPLPLYCKSYNLRGRKDVRATLDELAWKRSELTGKFIGCPFWSVGAKSLFDPELAQFVRGRVPKLDDAWQVADYISKQTSIANQKLTHEHVFPRRHLVACLQELVTPMQFHLIETLMERLAVGCVVLESEHDLLDSTRGTLCNPWLRYKGFNTLVENPEWPDFHRRMIIEAGLV